MCIRYRIYLKITDLLLKLEYLVFQHLRNENKKLGKYFEKKRHNKEENVTFWQENIFTQAAGTKTRIMGHTYFIKEGHREEKEMFIGKSTDLPVINVQ